MKFLFLEPFFGGSHRYFAEGLAAHSRYEIDLVTLPARFWKWRMRGAALYFLKNIPLLENYDGLITSDMMSLSDFRSLTGAGCPPALVYFHESQITYPLAPGEAMDVHFGFTDMTTALAAKRILFNSQTHFDAFFSKLPKFLKMMPDYRPTWVVDEIRSRADVLHPGCSIADLNAGAPPVRSEPPLIIWNHRWEFDKNPKDFFLALDEMVKRGLDFRLALLGENFQNCPKEFTAAQKRYGKRIVRYGYEPVRATYEAWLKEGTVVISTANQENFGISMVEAISAGCIPLLPQRLSYPEIVPESYHNDFLYNNQEELVEKLARVLSGTSGLEQKAEMLSRELKRFSWHRMIQQYDDELKELTL
ncbi:MAG: glycosyl transferase family 1 [Desulfobacteraceae bacterium 4572_87]|nr:MAG: glycosyl transferase family 1 [Desulfobacteraceae bacterium 4572_87]